MACHHFKQCIESTQGFYQQPLSKDLFLAQFLREQKAAHDLLKEQLLRAKTVYKEVADAHTQEGPLISKMDIIWLSTTSTRPSKKLDSNFMRPFTTMQQVNPIFSFATTAFDESPFLTNQGSPSKYSVIPGSLTPTPVCGWERRIWGGNNLGFKEKKKQDSAFVTVERLLRDRAFVGKCTPKLVHPFISVSLTSHGLASSLIFQVCQSNRRSSWVEWEITHRGPKGKGKPGPELPGPQL